MIVFKSTQDKVLAALQSVAGIVERRHTLPILANVLLRKTGSQVQLTTSDLEIQIRTTAELDGDSGNFATTLGARKLIDILRTMSGDQSVSLESSAGKLILKGGKSRFTLQSMPPEDFPLVQESASFGPVFSVPQKTLKSLLGQVSFSMAVHDIRYYLNGILFVAEGKQLSLVATDGHRLAFASAARRCWSCSACSATRKARSRCSSPPTRPSSALTAWSSSPSWSRASSPTTTA
jgi:DNA polymerase-3 subunit beta